MTWGHVIGFFANKTQYAWSREMEGSRSKYESRVGNILANNIKALKSADITDIFELFLYLYAHNDTNLLSFAQTHIALSRNLEECYGVSHNIVAPDGTSIIPEEGYSADEIATICKALRSDARGRYKNIYSATVLSPTDGTGTFPIPAVGYSIVPLIGVDGSAIFLPWKKDRCILLECHKDSLPEDHKPHIYRRPIDPKDLFPYILSDECNIYNPDDYDFVRTTLYYRTEENCIMCWFSSKALLDISKQCFTRRIINWWKYQKFKFRARINRCRLARIGLE
jgi:hypothetical protein